MTLLVTKIKFDYSSNTNPFHSPITEDGKHQIEAETKIDNETLNMVQTNP